MTNKSHQKPEISISTSSEDETQEKAKILGEYIRKGDLILLSGDLGAGKTRFVQGLTMGINSSQIARSPTFVLITEYSGNITLYHCDLYRIDKPEEVIDLELEELLDTGALAVEWPENGGNYIPNPDLMIYTIINGKNSRQLNYFSYSERGKTLIKYIKKNI